MKGPQDGLTRIEIAALIAVLRLDGDAYGVSIHDDIEQVRGQALSMAATYAALTRLARQRLIRSRQSAPVAVQGGRSRRLYAITSLGLTVLEHERAADARLWQALPTKRRA